jgi:uncharacterized protein YukJ
MEEQHDHPRVIKYVIHFADRHWWGGRATRTLYGNNSSIKDGELLIHQANGFVSVNYARVCFIEATLLPHEH